MVNYPITIRTKPAARKVIYPSPNNLEGGLNENASWIKNRKPPKNARSSDAELSDKVKFSHVSPDVVSKIKPVKKPNRWIKTENTGTGLDNKKYIKTCKPKKREIAKAISGKIIINSFKILSQSKVLLNKKQNNFNRYL